MVKKNIFEAEENNKDILSLSAKQLEKKIKHCDRNEIVPIPKFTLISYDNTLGLAGPDDTVTATFLEYLGDGAYQFVDDRGNYFVLPQQIFFQGLIHILHVPEGNSEN